METRIYPDVTAANLAAADLLSQWLVTPAVINVMLSGGNTPLQLYSELTRRNLPLSQLKIFALDEYVGVPETHPRNCANLIRACAVHPWGVNPGNYHTISSEPEEALESVRALEAKIDNEGGLDVVVLGLGINGHIGFNEPGSSHDSEARIVNLAESSVVSNREWFRGEFAPRQGATTGIKTILAARRILLLAFGAHKRGAVHAMLRGPQSLDCPASFLQNHPDTTVILDSEAAAVPA